MIVDQFVAVIAMIALAAYGFVVFSVLWVFAGTALRVMIGVTGVWILVAAAFWVML